MEGLDCNICFNEFSEETYVPKVLECGHTICLKCLQTLLQGQKFCPNCMKALSKSLEEYPTNFIIFQNITSSKNKFRFDLQEINSLTEKVALLLSKKETFKNSVETKISTLKNEIASKIEDFGKLHREELEFKDEDKRKVLVEVIDRLEEASKNLYSICNRKNKNRKLNLSQYYNEKHFLYDLVARLQNDEKIYACEDIINGEWKYGEITYSENRLNIHCLSSFTIGNDSFVVSLRDLRKCIDSKENILPFIRIGKEKLIFTLTDDMTPETIRVIKLCTGEGGQMLKGHKVDVENYCPGESENNSVDTSDLNRCVIWLPSSINGTGYEHALFKRKLYEMNIDEIILQDIKTAILIQKVPAKANIIFFNVVCKLQKNCQIDFDAMINKSVEDCGISFSF